MLFEKNNSPYKKAGKDTKKSCVRISLLFLIILNEISPFFFKKRLNNNNMHKNPLFVLQIL